MATFQITGPDGRKYRVTGDSPEGAMQALRKMVDASASAPRHPEFDPANVPGGVPGYNAETGMVEKQFGKGRSALMGAADTLTFGFGDEAASALGSAITGTPRERVLAQIRRRQATAQEQNPGSYLTGQIGGGVAQGIGLAGAGLSMGANAARAGAPLLRTAGWSAADGAILGALHGGGSGEGIGGRAAAAATGGTLGAGFGFAAPYAVAGGQALGRAVTAPILARFQPQGYAKEALGRDMIRSGMTPDDVADSLLRASADDQGMFNVADALGHSGQRRLSTIVRNPNNMRQTAVNTLTDRQLGQTERLTRTLVEGFDAPDTALQRTKALEGARTAAADINYEAARQDAGPVNLNQAIGTIDALMKRNPILGDSALTKTEIGSRLARIRSQMAARGEQLVDFDTVLNVKQDLGDVIAGLRTSGKPVPKALGDVYGELDVALENASKGYRLANDTYRTQSGVIDAVDDGKAASSTRTRATDNIARFGAMTPDEQTAFRPGYADVAIARNEAASLSPTTNRARPLLTGKTGQEFPAFAAPGKGDQMNRRIAREQTMFETANTALGGSKSSDNLADAAEMAQFDPGILVNMFRRPITTTVIEAVHRIANEAKGMPAPVMDRIAKTLLETNPDLAREMLKNAGSQTAKIDGRRALAQAIMLNMSASTSGRFAADEFRPRGQPLELTVRPTR